MSGVGSYSVAAADHGGGDGVGPGCEPGECGAGGMRGGVPGRAGDRDGAIHGRRKAADRQAERARGWRCTPPRPRQRTRTDLDGLRGRQRDIDRPPVGDVGGRDGIGAGARSSSVAAVGPTTSVKSFGPVTVMLAAAAGGSPLTPTTREPTDGPVASFPPQAAARSRSGEEGRESGDELGGTGSRGLDMSAERGNPCADRGGSIQVTTSNT